MIYEAANLALIPRVPKATKRLLDVGCGTGSLAKKIKQALNCSVVGITYSETEADLARNYIDDVVVCDLNSFEPKELGRFDCIVCSHILEHLHHPEKMLRRLMPLLATDGALLIALPNVLFWRQRLEFLRGRFKYEDGGLMDRTHYRFYDWRTAQDLLTESGFSVLTAEADGSFPLSRFLPGLGKLLDRAALKLAPGLFGVQFVFVCKPGSN